METLRRTWREDPGGELTYGQVEHSCFGTSAQERNQEGKCTWVCVLARLQRAHVPEQKIWESDAIKQYDRIKWIIKHRKIEGLEQVYRILQTDHDNVNKQTRYQCQQICRVPHDTLWRSRSVTRASRTWTKEEDEWRPQVTSTGEDVIDKEKNLVHTCESQDDASNRNRLFIGWTKFNITSPKKLLI